MEDLLKELIEATEEWHSVEDCKAEGRTDCRLCKAIEAAQQSVQADVCRVCGQPMEKCEEYLITGKFRGINGTRR